MGKRSWKRAAEDIAPEHGLLLAFASDDNQLKKMLLEEAKEMAKNGTLWDMENTKEIPLNVVKENEKKEEEHDQAEHDDQDEPFADEEAALQEEAAEEEDNTDLFHDLGADEEDKDIKATATPDPQDTLELFEGEAEFAKHVDRSLRRSMRTRKETKREGKMTIGDMVALQEQEDLEDAEECEGDDLEECEGDDDSSD